MSRKIIYSTFESETSLFSAMLFSNSCVNGIEWIAELRARTQFCFLWKGHILSASFLSLCVKTFLEDSRLNNFTGCNELFSANKQLISVLQVFWKERSKLQPTACNFWFLLVNKSHRLSRDEPHVHLRSSPLPLHTSCGVLKICLKIWYFLL